jgi:hypothetical protein
MRVTRSRGGEQGRTLRNRPHTPRTSGAASVIRTPSPNRARRSASGEPTTALPSRDEQMDGEAQPNQENQPSIVAPSVQEEVQPQTDQQQQGNPGNDSGQPASDQSRPPTPNWTGFALPPNFQQARENDRRAHETGEDSSHPTYSRIWNRTSVVAMEPLSINHNLYLDYRDSQILWKEHLLLAKET